MLRKIGRKWARPLSVTLGLLALLGSCPRPAVATDRIWTGASSINWNTAGNWNTGIPSAGDNAVFNSTFTNQPNLSVNKTVGGIWMTGSIGQNVTISGASTLTLDGNTINGTAGLGILIDNANAFTLTIAAPVILGGSQTWKNNSGNLFTVSAGGVDMNGSALTINGTGNTTVTGVISNSGTITKSGTGMLTLSGTNTYTGTTTVSAGILNIQNAAGLGGTGSGTTVSSGATLQLQGGITVGAETLNINGTGASGQTGALVNVSGTNNYGGLLTLAGATTISSDSGTLNLTDAGTITGATFGLTLAGAGNGTVSSIIGTTSGGLTKTGAGTWTLSGANTYTGLTTISAGTLAYGATNVIATGGVSVNGATAVLALGSNHRDTVGTVTVAGGGSITGTGTSALKSTGTFEMQSGSVSAILDGAGIALNKTTAGTVTLSGANTYTGGTSINAGTLTISSDTALGNSSGALAFNGGTLEAGGDFTSSRAITFSAGGGLIDTAGHAVILNGAISGAGALVKYGAGTLKIIGANPSFTGPATISTGTLILSGATGNGVFTIQNGGELDANGTIGNLNVQSGGTIAPGDSVTALLNIGNLSHQTGAHLAIEIGGTTAGASVNGYDRISVTGGITLAGDLQGSLLGGFTPHQGDLFFLIVNDGTDAISGTFATLPQGSAVSFGGVNFVIGYAGDSTGGTFSGGNDVVLLTVPEPNALLSAIAGIGLLLRFQRRRRS